MKREMTRRRVVGNQLIADNCLVCGMDNHIGLHAQFMNLEDGCVYAEFMPRFELQSYPDRVHGGITSSLMDEILSRAIQNESTYQLSVTIELSLKYRAPLSLDKPVRAIAWVERDRSRVYDARGQVVLEDGTVAVEAWGKYLKADIYELGGEEGREYFFKDTRPCPEFVEI
ncbi:MAG: PaaI family thioesterase [Coriobacteriales bacterium]